MKKIWFAFICAAALLSFAGCKKKNDAGAAMAKMSEFKDRMCKCADKACADKVQEDMTKWGTEQAKASEGKTQKVDEETTKKMTAITEEYGKCMMKAMGGGGDMGGGSAAAGSDTGGGSAAAGSDTGSAAPAAGSDTGGSAAGGSAAPAAGSAEEKK